MTCNCATWGSAAHCPVHTQADFDAAKPDDPQVTEQDIRTFAQKVLSLGWDWGQGYHSSDNAQMQLRRYLREFFDYD